MEGIKHCSKGPLNFPLKIECVERLLSAYAEQFTPYMLSEVCRGNDGG